MDEDGHLPRLEAVGAGSMNVEDFVYSLNLDEVVSGAHRPELTATAIARARRNRGRVPARETAA